MQPTSRRIVIVLRFSSVWNVEKWLCSPHTADQVVVNLVNNLNFFNRGARLHIMTCTRNVVVKWLNVASLVLLSLFYMNFHCVPIESPHACFSLPTRVIANFFCQPISHRARIQQKYVLYLVTLNITRWDVCVFCPSIDRKPARSGWSFSIIAHRYSRPIIIALHTSLGTTTLNTTNVVASINSSSSDRCRRGCRIRR